MLADIHTIRNKRVLLRADLNVPINDNTIVDDFRLISLQPTLHLLLENQCTVTLITHIGGGQQSAKHPSTSILAPWFSRCGYKTIFANSIPIAYSYSMNNLPGTIIILENLRMYPQEVMLDISFAQSLATLGDYIIQDAFGALHDNHTSMTILPRLFAQNRRAVGLLILKELKVLEPIRNDPKKPFSLIIGGNKVAKKMQLLIDMAHKAQHMLLCPALVFSYMHAQNIAVGKSLIDQKTKKLCDMLMQTSGSIISLPRDYVVAPYNDMNSERVIRKGEFTNSDVGISIGPETVTFFSEIINRSKTVVLNGLFGLPQHPSTMEPMSEIIDAMANSKAVTIVAGGDSVAFARTHPMASQITHFSTGGGSTIAWLAGCELPGLTALTNDQSASTI